MKQKLPLVSCITPTRNRHHMLDRLITMFMSQTWTNKELIIIDDSITPYHLPGNLPPYIKYYHIKVKRPLSIGNKRNKAIQYANGSYIAFMDDDDFHGKNRISTQMTELLKGNCDMFVPKSIYYHELNGNKIFTIDSQFKNIIYHNGFITTCMVFKKKLFNIIKFRNISIAEDAYFIIDLQAKIGVTICSSKKLSQKNFLYTIHDSNTWKLHIPEKKRIYTSL